MMKTRLLLMILLSFLLVHCGLDKKAPMDQWSESEYLTALSEVDSLIQVDPNSALQYTDRGYYLYRLGRLEEAQQSLSKAISLNPAMAKSYLYSGMVYEQKGELQGSIALYTKAIELNSEEANYYYCRGTALHDLGDLAAACQDWQKMVELEDNRGKEFLTKYCNN